MLIALRRSFLYQCLDYIVTLPGWIKNKFSSPSPHFIKQACLIRNGVPNAIWVETGTYLGLTTKKLSANSQFVYSIEPEPFLFKSALQYFKNYPNVEILNGTSEDIFPKLLSTLSGDINFWLDGHYSSGITFKGPVDTPILSELFNIELNMNRFGRLCVMIDDIRCFQPNIPEFSAYPPLDAVVDWARKLDLKWHIEHDIFVAKNYID